MNFKQYVKKYPWQPGLFFIGLVTLIVYYSSLFYPFYPNLDDARLIWQNPSVTNFPHGFLTMFTGFVYGLYHPFTTASLGFDWFLWGNHPLGFRLHNLVLHLVNVLLVFLVVYRISKNQKLGLLVASVFSLHPMHVESVIWISERKDVLFTFYFLLSLLTYHYWQESKQKIALAATWLFFISSLFSKATAVVLPLFLLVMDYNNKTLSRKAIFSKIPMLLLSLVFGILNLKAQQTIDFIQPISETYSLPQLISLPAYSFTWYITQLFVPLNLNIKHLYPRIIDGDIGFIYYSGWFWLLVLGFMVYKFRKNRLFVTGILWYFFSIILVVKIIPTGNDIVSERYSYVPYIGLTLSFGAVWIPFLEKMRDSFIYGFIVLILMLLGFGTLQQQKHWKDEKQIWTRVAQVEPELPLAWFERGKVFQGEQNYPSALADFKEALQVEPLFYQASLQSGICYYLLGNADSARYYFDNTIAISPNLATNYFQRGYFYYRESEFNEALTDFTTCEKMGFQNTELFYYKALTLKEQKEFQQSLEVFKVLYKNDAHFPKGHFEMAQVYLELQQYQEAIPILKQLFNQEPANLQTAYVLANTLARVQKYSEALQYYNLVIEKKPDFGAAWLNRGNTFLLTGNITQARMDWEKAKNLGVESATKMLKKY